MPRAKGGSKTRQRRKKILKQAKGYFGGRRKLYRTAAETVLRAGAFAYKGRKQKKRRARALWIIRVNAACRQLGLSYSVFMNGLEEGGRRDRPQDPRRAGRLRPGRLRQARGDGPGPARIAWRRTGSKRSSTGPWRMSPGPDPRPTSSRCACACSAARASSPALLRALGGIPAAERPRVGQEANRAKVMVEAAVGGAPGGAEGGRAPAVARRLDAST